MAKIAKKVRNARDEGRQQQWFQRKRRGFSNGWLKKNVNYNRPDKLFSKAPGAYVPWEPSGNVPGTGQGIGPILTQLNTAKTQLALHTAQGRTNAISGFNGAITLLNALKGEVVTTAVAECNAGKANATLGTNPGDDAGIVNANNAIAAVNQF